MKKLAAVTRQDAIDYAVTSYMRTVLSGIGNAMSMECDDTNSDGSPHFCMYSAAREAGWIEQIDGKLLNLGTGETNVPYSLTLEGVNVWCRQHLIWAESQSKHWDEGEVVELVRNLFKEHPEELNSWRNIVRQYRLSEELENDTA